MSFVNTIQLPDYELVESVGVVGKQRLEQQVYQVQQEVAV